MSTDQTLFADGYDEAIIGYTPTEPARVIYSATKMIEICTENSDMSYDEACEFLSYNTWQAYVGEGTPIYLWEANRQEIEYFILDQ